MSRIFEFSERAWKHVAMATGLFLLFSGTCLWWLFRTPSLGYAIGFLAVVAAVMAALMENLGAMARFAWIILLFGFLWIETRAIDDDKQKATKELTEHFGSLSGQAEQNLKNILDAENKNFRDVLSNQERNSSATLRQLLNQQKEQNREFNAILAKQQQLFEHEDQLAESLNGRLVPASETTPENTCPAAQGDSVLLFLGEAADQNTVRVTHFPRTVVAIQDVGPVITLDRATDGSIGVAMDIRSKDRRIVVRLNPNGFVVNKNNFLEVHKDKSSLVIVDEYGNEVLNAHYLNRQAFVLKGILTYPDRNPIPLSFAPRMRHVCLSNAGSIDLMISQ